MPGEACLITAGMGRITVLFSLDGMGVQLPPDKIVEETSGSVTICDGQWVSREPSLKLPL